MERTMKRNGIPEAFLCGGIMGFICQLLTLLIIRLGVTKRLIINLGPVYIMIVLTFLLYLPGIYSRLTKNGAMGAILPITGLVAGLADAIAGGRASGLGRAEATKKGLASIGIVLAYGLMAAFALALIARLFGV